MTTNADTWLDYLAAFGQVGAAVVAVIALLVTLYLNVWRERRRQPKLSLTVADTSDYQASWDIYSDERHGSFAPLDLEVRNPNGRRTARDVEVLLTADRGVWGMPALDDWEWMENEIELERLAWVQGRVSEEWRAEPMDVPAGLTRRLRLGLLGHPKVVLDLLPSSDSHDHVDDVLVVGQLGILTIPPLRGVQHPQHWLENDYGRWSSHGAMLRLRLTIIGSNVDAVHYSTTLHVTAHSKEDGQFDVRPNWTPLKKVKD